MINNSKMCSQAPAASPAAAAPAASAPAAASPGGDLDAAITAQGLVVRDLKAKDPKGVR